MKKNNLVKGCIIMMLLCLTGCGTDVNGKQEEMTAVESTSEDIYEEDTEDVQEEESTAGDTESSATTEKSNNDNAMLEGEAAQLSDDLYSYQIVINGKLYQVPMDVEELLDEGWKFDEDENAELDAYTYTPNVTLYMGDYQIGVDIVNKTESSQPYSACEACGISINLYYNSDNDIVFILPKGIQSNVASVEDMKAAYGEPTDFSEMDGMAFATYEVEYASKEIKFTFDENKLVDIEVRNEDF